MKSNTYQPPTSIHELNGFRVFQEIVFGSAKVQTTVFISYEKKLYTH